MAMLPDVRIETKRLILRPFGVQDLGEVLAVMEAGDREALPPGAPADADEVGGWLEDAVHRLHRDGGGIQRVELRANTDNLPSARVAQKAGYTREGTLRRALREEDGLHDLAIYSRLSAL